MADFHSFKEVGYYLDKVAEAYDIQVNEAKRSLALYMQEQIRSKHWVQQPWRPPTNSPTPLVDTWQLRKAVSFTLKWPDIRLYSRKEWLARIHEYWATRKMTDKQRKYLFWVVFKDSAGWVSSWLSPKGYITIPARPIWRTILKDPLVKVWAEKRVENYLNKLFK